MDFPLSSNTYMSYSLPKLLKDFPDSNTCLSYLFQKKYPNFQCPQCKRVGFFRQFKDRPLFGCTCGKYQISPYVDTVFANSKIELHTWFQVIYFMLYVTVNAKNIQGLMGISYHTALGMQGKIMEVMQQNIKDKHHLSQWSQKVKSVYKGVNPENLPLYEACMQFKSEMEKLKEEPFFYLLHLLMNIDGK